MQRFIGILLLALACTARMAHDMALGTAMQILVKEDILIYKQFVENDAFKRFVGDMVFAMTNQPQGPSVQ